MASILGVSQAEFIGVAEEVLAKLLALHEYPDKEDDGVYIEVRTKTFPQPLLITRIGNAPSRPTKSFDLVQEKCDRVFRNLELGHFTSGQSQDPDNAQYAGAVTAPPDSWAGGQGHELIIGGSGLCADGDEAMSAVLLSIFRWITYRDLRAIFGINDNCLIMPLCEACNNLYDRVVHRTLP